MSVTKTVKLDGWKPQAAPEEGAETETYRRFIVEAVELLYDVNRRRTTPPFQVQPIALKTIYVAVKNRIVALMLRDQWPHYGFFDKTGQPHIRMKRWVDRRVNEAASREHGAKIASQTAGFYIPNNGVK